MSSTHGDDIWLQQYNAHRNLALNPQPVAIPEVILPPTTLDDYKTLSSLVVTAYEHANSIGAWCEDRENGRTVGKYAVECISLSLCGLRLLAGRIMKARLRGDFSLFDGVSPLPVSIHTEMIEAIWFRSLGLCGLYSRILHVDLVTLMNYSAEKVTRLFELSGVSLAPYDDHWETFNVAEAELSKVGVYLSLHKSADSSPKPSTNGKSGGTRSGTRTTSRRNEIWLRWREEDDMQAKDIASKWNRENPADLVKPDAVRQGIYRARSERLKKKSKDKSCDNL